MLTHHQPVKVPSPFNPMLMRLSSSSTVSRPCPAPVSRLRLPLHATTKGSALVTPGRTPIRPVSRVVSKELFSVLLHHHTRSPFGYLQYITSKSTPRGLLYVAGGADVFVEMLKNKKTVIPRASFLFIGAGYALRDCLTLRYSQGCYPCVVPELPMGYQAARATRPRLHSSDGMPKLNSVTQLPKEAIYLLLLP